jgi:hypothetical protein
MCSFFCPQCQKETEMLSLKEAATAAGVTTRTIYNWREELHVMETPGGRKLICKSSMVRLCSPDFDRR